MTFLGIIALLGLLILVQNRVYRKRALEDLDYTCHLDRHEIFEGETFTLTETLTNRKPLMLPWLKSELTTSAGLDFQQSQKILADKTRFVPSFFLLHGYEKVARHWTVTGQTFGYHNVSRTVLVASDLLGFVTESMPISIEEHITVLPRPFDLEALEMDLRADLGELVIKRRLITDPFFSAGVRPYQPTDDLKQIHWYASAREQELMVFEEESTLNQSLAVIINGQTTAHTYARGVDETAVRAMIRLAATLIDQTIALGLPVRLASNLRHPAETPGLEAADTLSPVATGEAHAHSLMRLLATIPYDNTRPTERYLPTLTPRLLESTDIFLITHYIDPVIIDFATRFTSERATVKLVLTGPNTKQFALPTGCTIIPLYKHIQQLSYRDREVSHDN